MRFWTDAVSITVGTPSGSAAGRALFSAGITAWARGRELTPTRPPARILRGGKQKVHRTFRNSG